MKRPDDGSADRPVEPPKEAPTDRTGPLSGWRPTVMEGDGGSPIKGYGGLLKSYLGVVIAGLLLVVLILALATCVLGGAS